MSGKNEHLRTLGPAPSCPVVQPPSGHAQAPAAETKLPPEYFRELLTPRCKRDGVCDECGMCGH
ncbi:MAG: hypothetical protein IKR07_00415 [Oscillospiraceae bacterium]|nr:hypothetical protein [Oscillospiraceae bacterium]